MEIGATASGRFNTPDEDYELNTTPRLGDNADDNFLGTSRNLEADEDTDHEYMEPVELIVSRVLFALLVSISLVLNLLLVLAVIRRRRTIHVIYCLATAMLVPDLIFYTKLVIELMNWGQSVPTWAKSDWSCGLWQFATHWYPLLYSVLLCAIVYHAFITLFLDYSGGYEEGSKNYLPFTLTAIFVTTAFMASPSGIYSEAMSEDASSKFAFFSHFRQYCDLAVTPLVADADTPGIREESTAIYRLVYELILPYILPLTFLAFPYVTLMVGLMRSVPAASHSEHSTKITVVVTLWLVTSYLMLHVTTVLRNVFSIFSVWHRLVALFDAYDDKRVPKFQTYIHIVAYVLTCLWGIVRASLCFKYNIKLRKALGP